MLKSANMSGRHFLQHCKIHCLYQGHGWNETAGYLVRHGTNVLFDKVHFPLYNTHMILLSKQGENTEMVKPNIVLLIETEENSTIYENKEICRR